MSQSITVYFSVLQIKAAGLNKDKLSDTFCHVLILISTTVQIRHDLYLAVCEATLQVVYLYSDPREIYATV